MTEITGFSSACASNMLDVTPTEITIFDNNNKSDISACFKIFTLGNS